MKENKTNVLSYSEWLETVQTHINYLVPLSQWVKTLGCSFCTRFCCNNCPVYLECREYLYTFPKDQHHLFALEVLYDYSVDNKLGYEKRGLKR